ncbi:type II secretion system F family protein [Rhodopseudomonas rhenobacensis]|nr:type II secretion system F family protein [Rhodopseudomonas rhenobacensis]
MPSFRYRALNDSGELVSGAIVAATQRDVVARVEQLGLVLVDNVAVDEAKSSWSLRDLFNRPKPADVTLFTRDLALLLRAGARINDGLDLLVSDRSIGRMKTVVLDIRARVLSGESFADALARYPDLFAPMYVALVRVGEASGSLDSVLEVLAGERERSELLRRKLSDAIRYPIFILVAAGGVLTFFMFFVLPQFASVLQDFNAKTDPIITFFLSISTFLRASTDTVLLVASAALLSAWLLLRQKSVRRAITRVASRPPIVRQLIGYYQTAIFCRNLGVLLSSGVNLTVTLRILVDMMASTGDSSSWKVAAERVRHGAKLSDALSESLALPPMAARMLRLGDETGQLPLLAGRVAEFYEEKLQRSLDRAVGIAGPAAVIAISVVVGGLIVSIMTALMSVSQIVG